MSAHPPSSAFLDASGAATSPWAARRVPASAGIGLRLPHLDQVLAEHPTSAWFEVHPENHLTPAAADDLAAVADRYPLSLHAVGLSLGSAAGLDREHLLRLKALERRIRPGLMSDHLSWSLAMTGDGPLALPDLLPLPYTEEALTVVASNVARAQQVLDRQILIENPSTYLTFAASILTEAEFLGALVRATGCGVLLDLNNIHVGAMNAGRDPRRALEGYLTHIPHAAIGEIHLAGHAVRLLPGGRRLRIDDHGSPVCPEVWALYERTVAVLGPRPTLIEWDTAIPAFSVLQAEAARAQQVIDHAHAR